jgi:hypothetical protein
MDAADLATLAAVVVAGPWGLVLAIALLRGYSITISLRRRRSPAVDAPQDPTVPQRREVPPPPR